jgi:hypothetical protein
VQSVGAVEPLNKKFSDVLCPFSIPIRIFKKVSVIFTTNIEAPKLFKHGKPFAKSIKHCFAYL